MDFRLCILVGKGQGKSFNLALGKEYTVGRYSEDDIRIEDQNISRNHFKIRIHGGKYFITDLGSKNGTFVEGKNLRPGVETEVKEGVPIVVGMTILGLGGVCESCLKPFLVSAGFTSEVNEYGEVIKPLRAMAIKKNLEFIYNMNNSLKESRDLKEIFNKLLDNVFNLFKRIDRCVIITIDDQTGEFGDIFYRSRKPVDDPKKIYNKELVEQALIMNRPVIVKDSSRNEEEDYRVTESLQLMKIRSAMCVPITSLYSIRGVIYLDSLSSPKGFRKNDLALLKDVSGRAALAMDNMSLQMGYGLGGYKDLLKFLNHSKTQH
jgi:two-component system, NtrC family, sensor kinase